MPPDEPKPEPPRIESRAELSDAMTQAIAEKNVSAARSLMERAFWSNIGFYPDWFHLFLSIQKEDREMTRFLLAHDARMTPAQTSIIARAMPAQMAPLTTLLAAHGIHPLPANTEPDGLTLVQTLYRLHREADHYCNAEEKSKTAQALQENATAAFIHYMGVGNVKTALHVLRLAGQDTQQGIDITAPLRALLKKHYPDVIPALSLLNTFTRDDAPVKIKPVNLKLFDYLFAPRLVVGLANSGLIGERMYADRVDFLRSSLTVTISRYKKHDHDMAVLHLFNKDIPATGKEVEDFLSLHKDFSRKNPQDMDLLLEKLSRYKFFDAPAWTPEKLITLKNQQQTPSELTDSFNLRAHRQLIRTHGIDSFLNLPQIRTLVEAHRIGAFRAGPEETGKILDLLRELMKLNNVLDEARAERVSPRDFVFSLVASLKNNGADFSAVDPMKYLGKTDPGLAKILLDLEIVEAENFDLHALQKLNGGEMEIVIPPSDRRYPYTEFMAQIIMGNNDPKKYLSLLHGTGASWQETLRQTLTDRNAENIELSLKFKRRGTARTGPR